MGIMLMIMILMLVFLFLIECCNYVLFVLIGGFYGFVIMGIVLGMVVVSVGYWYWLFGIFGLLFFCGFIFSYMWLWDDVYKGVERFLFDGFGFLLVGVLVVLAVFIFIYLLKWGFLLWYMLVGFGGSFVILLILLIM